jgi:ankyrin repeat protein
LAAVALPSTAAAQAERRQAPEVVRRLHQAARDGDLAALRSSLRQGVDVDVRDESGRTALIEAAEHGRIEAAPTGLE